MRYTKKVIEHFQKPHNQGALKNADAVGQVGNPSCGDVMKIYLKIGKNKKREENIKNIKFETLGCAAAIAVSSALTDRAKGMTLARALTIEKDDIVKDLGGLPPAKIHCSMLGVEALHQAIEKYQKNNKAGKLIKIMTKKNAIDKIKNVLEKIRPSLQMDGGDVQFVDFDAKSGVLKVELMGHCAHCPMSTITLKQGIEAEIKRAASEVKEVQAVQV